MGRRRTVNRDLPARLYLKRDGYYYRDLNRRETKVAAHLILAAHDASAVWVQKPSRWGRDTLISGAW